MSLSATTLPRTSLRGDSFEQRDPAEGAVAPHGVAFDAVLARAVEDDAVAEVALRGARVVLHDHVLDDVLAAAPDDDARAEVLDRAVADGDAADLPQDDAGTVVGAVAVAEDRVAAQVEGDDPAAVTTRADPLRQVRSRSSVVSSVISWPQFRGASDSAYMSVLSTMSFDSAWPDRAVQTGTGHRASRLDPTPRVVAADAWSRLGRRYPIAVGGEPRPAPGVGGGPGGS
jgi:hypothetical protein